MKPRTSPRLPEDEFLCDYCDRWIREGRVTVDDMGRIYCKDCEKAHLEWLETEKEQDQVPSKPRPLFGRIKDPPKPRRRRLGSSWPFLLLLGLAALGCAAPPVPPRSVPPAATVRAQAPARPAQEVDILEKYRVRAPAPYEKYRVRRPRAAFQVTEGAWELAEGLAGYGGARTRLRREPEPSRTWEAFEEWRADQDRTRREALERETLNLIRFGIPYR